MTPKFLTETRAFFETEIAFWQAQGNDMLKKNVAQTEALVKETRERFQAAADAQNNALNALWKHNVEAAERGMKLVSDAFSLPA
ncbi:hypothetical protein L6V77_06640 [Myxococcota bacterium]|jgi:hypothetical protein|nr:hypothetical protein [Myxococcota bacterium]